MNSNIDDNFKNMIITLNHLDRYRKNVPCHICFCLCINLRLEGGNIIIIDARKMDIECSNVRGLENFDPFSPRLLLLCAFIDVEYCDGYETDLPRKISINPEVIVAKNSNTGFVCLKVCLSFEDMKRGEVE